MAQLRDAVTSEWIAEGTPLEIAILAEAFDAADVLFDDVGATDSKGRSRFDPAALRATRAAELAGLEAALASAASPDEREALQGVISERKARIAAGRAMVAAARARQQAARDRVQVRR